MSVEAELQEAAETGSLVIGTEETLKDIDAVERIVLASNVPADIEQAVRDAADGAGAAVEKVDKDNRQLGSLCMKPFTASVVGIR